MRCAWLTLIGALLIAAPVHANWVSGEEAIMGTAIRVELWQDDAGDTRVRDAIDAVMNEMRRIDRLMSPFIPASELSRINREAAARAIVIDRELFDLIRTSLQFSELTHGAFDITFSSVGYLYDYRAGVKPTDAQVTQVLPNINYRHIALDPARSEIQFLRKGVRIDLGGIAKGYAVDRGIEVLRAHGIREGLVSAGGDSRVIGSRRGRPWMIGIRDPRGAADKPAAMLPLQDAAISTSGDYERFFERDGVRHHHIINPRTGRAADTVRSVTIIGADATTTDALSTGVFVLGVDAGMALVHSLKNIDAVIIDRHGKLFFSSGLAAPTDTGNKQLQPKR